MKKIILSVFLFICLFWSQATFWNCWFQNTGTDNNISISDQLTLCLSDTKVVNPPADLEVVQGGWFNTFLLLWVDAISWILAVLAVGAIVYGSLLLTLSMWDDEKITKWKDTIKWWIIWFIGILVANTLIELIINILYDI